MSADQTIDAIVRAAWRLVEQAGGSLTVDDPGPVVGAFHAAWGNGKITLTTGRQAPASKQ